MYDSGFCRFDMLMSQQSRRLGEFNNTFVSQCMHRHLMSLGNTVLSTNDLFRHQQKKLINSGKYIDTYLSTA